MPWRPPPPQFYGDVIMTAMASQITSLTIVYLTAGLFGRRSKKTSKLRVTGLCHRNSPVTGELPAQRASNAENASISWRHHEFYGITVSARPLFPAAGGNLFQFQSKSHGKNKRHFMTLGQGFTFKHHLCQMSPFTKVQFSLTYQMQCVIILWNTK